MRGIGPEVVARPDWAGLRIVDRGALWSIVSATSCSAAWLRLSGSVTRAHPTRVAVDGPPAAGRPPSPTSWPSSCVTRAAMSSAPRSTTSSLLGRSATHGAGTCPKAATSMPRPRRADPVLLDPRGRRRSTLPTRGLRPHRGFRAVPAGHDRPRQRRAGLRRRLPPAPRID